MALSTAHTSAKAAYPAKQGAPGHGKSWNLGRDHFPGLESRGKVMENDDNVMEFLLLH